MGLSKKVVVRQIFKKLFDRFGKQHWWPGETNIEVIVGAVLTQNTNWTNVEKAINNLKAKRSFTLQALHKISPQKLASLIKPSGYFNVKAVRLKNLISFIMHEYQGNLSRMSQEPTIELRKKLLTVKGVGEETADSILLYAFDKPIFVVDAYTKRIFSRYNLVDENISYHHLQEVFMSTLKSDTRTFNEYHALIVRLGKEICRPKPLCESCPLKRRRSRTLKARSYLCRT